MKDVVVSGRTLPRGWSLAAGESRQVAEDRWEVQIAVLTRSRQIESYTWAPYERQHGLPCLSEFTRSFYDPVRPWF